MKLFTTQYMYNVQLLMQFISLNWKLSYLYTCVLFVGVTSTATTEDKTPQTISMKKVSTLYIRYEYT